MTQPPRIIAVDPSAPAPNDLEPAASALGEAKLVAFPTETVYGLGANALDTRAVERIFAAKERPASNPLIVHVAAVDAARRVVDGWPPIAQSLADRFWPGPLTLVLPRADTVPDAVTAGLDTVAVRMPAHPVARQLIRQAGLPVAAPSANRYTEVSPTRADHVVESLGDAVEIVVDAGPTEIGVESTVLSLCGERPEILRPGMITIGPLREVVAEVVYISRQPADDDAGRPSPGMARKHYAPRARVRLIDDVDALMSLMGAAAKAGWMVLDGLDEQRRPSGRVVVMGRDPDAYAARLYETLRDLDAQGCEVIVVQCPPQTDRWRAIHDRLSRAAH